MNKSEGGGHTCDSHCAEERGRLAPLDTYFAQCLEGRTQLRVGMNERFECPRVQKEFETLSALCSIAQMTRPEGGRRDLLSSATIAHRASPSEHNED